jgi:hypothetical protein
VLNRHWNACALAMALRRTPCRCHHGELGGDGSPKESFWDGAEVRISICTLKSIFS